MSHTHEAGSHHHHHEGIGNIALSLSGGGVRAVGFHLGTLEMLDRLGLRERIRILSTVSGGSLTGTGYALSQQLGHSFDKYFADFYDFLPKLNTVEKLMDGLGQDAAPSPSGRRDMITVMANIYDSEYFSRYFSDDGSSPRFGVLLDAPREGNHLSEIIFNATEFQTGTAFRFQRSASRCLIGNGNIFLCPEHARKIRMADIMASSSCIPVGMEPLFFPHDFHWPDDPESPDGPRPTCDAIRASLKSRLHQKFRLYRDQQIDYFALMDGGVYDNQGVVSVLLAMNRLARPAKEDKGSDCYCGNSLYKDSLPPSPDQWVRWLSGKDKAGEDEPQDATASEAHRIGMVLISDTPVLKDSLYPKVAQAASHIELAPSRRPGHMANWLGRQTIGRLDTLGWVVAAALLLSAGLTFWEEIWPNRDAGEASLWQLLDDIFVVAVPLVLTAGLGLLLFRARRALRELAGKLGAVLPPERWKNRNTWQYLRRLRVADLLDMLNLRVGSVSALTASVFMERIRALVYAAAYLREGVEHHVVPNQIFALEKNASGKVPDWPDGLSDHAHDLSETGSAIVSMAAHMPTKLWINRVRHAEYGSSTHPAMSDPLARAAAVVCALNDEREIKGAAPLTDLDVLVVSGQLTTCYRIMAHLYRDHRPGGQWQDEESREVFERCVELWNRLAADPLCLLDARKQQAGMAA